jgi:tetratricopeptide (TPR) repeat protein
MTTEDDDEELTAELDSDEASDEALPQRMVRTALSHKAVTGDPTPVVDMMALAAPNTCDFWVEVAEELHAQSEHYEAIDAWRKAKAVAKQPNSTFDPEDMAKTLWHVSDFGNDAYLAETAAYAYADAGKWDAYLTILHRIGTSRDRLLKAFREVLESGTKLDFDGAWEIDGTCVDSIEYADLTSWSMLANAHFLLGNISEAFETWAMMARKEPVNGVLYSAIPCLIELARKNELNEEDYLPGISRNGR